MVVFSYWMEASCKIEFSISLSGRIFVRRKGLSGIAGAISNLKIKSDISHLTSNILTTSIEYLKGVGPLRGDLLRKELEIFTFEDLLNHFPHRHIDKTKVNKIVSINYQTDFAQVAGILQQLDVMGTGRAKRLVAQLKDESGSLELAWFQG